MTKLVIDTTPALVPVKRPALVDTACRELLMPEPKVLHLKIVVREVGRSDGMAEIDLDLNVDKLSGRPNPLADIKEGLMFAAGRAIHAFVDNMELPVDGGGDKPAP